MKRRTKEEVRTFIARHISFSYLGCFHNPRSKKLIETEVTRVSDGAEVELHYDLGERGKNAFIDFHLNNLSCCKDCTNKIIDEFEDLYEEGEWVDDENVFDRMYELFQSLFDLPCTEVPVEETKAA